MDDVVKSKLAGALKATGVASVKNTPTKAFNRELSTPNSRNAPHSPILPFKIP